MFEWISSPEAWVALGTLAALEIVLGIDNIIFISILVGRLPAAQREKARQIGLILAMLTRIALLFSISWVMGLTETWFSAFGQAISGRDVILILGGLFLLAKSTHEIHASFEIADDSGAMGRGGATFAGILVQIALLDIVFSFDSVITAVGLADDLPVMVIAIVIAVGVMMLAARPVGDFVDENPTIKILALSFLIMVGMTLIVEAFDVHVPKGYIYFAMAFSVAVEIINIRLRRRTSQVIHLSRQYPDDSDSEGQA